VYRWMLGVMVICISGAASAQTFYKWTDERGVVHFSDAPPPPRTGGVEERKLPPPSSQESALAESPGAAAASATEPDAIGKKSAEPGEGPAHVIIVSRQTPRTGPSTLHVLGEVKNVGGDDAHAVGVTITALDSSQGAPCLTQQVAVAPSTLRAGETGQFDIDVDSPCLLGEANVDVAPAWE